MWSGSREHFAVTTPQISLTEAQEEMCLSNPFLFWLSNVPKAAVLGSGCSNPCSVVSADMEQSLAPETQTSGPWQD